MTMTPATKANFPEAEVDYILPLVGENRASRAFPHQRQNPVLQLHSRHQQERGSRDQLHERQGQMG